MITTIWNKINSDELEKLFEELELDWEDTKNNYIAELRNLALSGLNEKTIIGKIQSQVDCEYEAYTNLIDII